MKVNIFKPKNKKLVGGFTNDATGQNLPNQDWDWQYSHSVELEEDSPLIGANPKEILKDIEEQGYSIQQSKITTKEI